VPISCAPGPFYPLRVSRCTASTQTLFANRLYGTSGVALEFKISRLTIQDFLGNERVYYPTGATDTLIDATWTSVTITQPSFSVRPLPVVLSYLADPPMFDLTEGQIRLCSNVTIQGNTPLLGNTYVINAWVMYDGPQPHTAPCTGPSANNPQQNNRCWRGPTADGMNTILRYCENIINYGVRGGTYGITGVVVDDGQCSNDAYQFPQQVQYSSCNTFNAFFNDDNARPQACYFAKKAAASSVTASFGLLAMLIAAALALH